MNESKNRIRLFDKDELIYKLLILIAVIIFGFLVFKVVDNFGDVDTFKTVSKKPFKEVSNKEEALNLAYSGIENVSLVNENLSPTNLNISKIYKEVKDEEDKNFFKENSPIPTTIDSIIEADEEEEVEEEQKDIKTSAFQIYEKMQRRYQTFRQSLYSMVGTKPVNVVRQYQYDGYSIIGKYNPEDSSHVPGKRHTWFIQNFQNVNIYYQDGDGKPLDDDNNIKDIMSMASVYTYYRNPYDVDTFLKYCYNLFDSSYSCVASVSEVYFCSGCMHYDEENVATGSVIKNEPTLEKIKKETIPQKVLPKDIPYKAGKLQRLNNDNHTVLESNYAEYVQNIYNGHTDPILNYCPGHIDLNLYVKVLTIDSANSLFSIDKLYGNKGSNYQRNWHGWDIYKKNEARLLSYKDWERDYGLSVSFIEFIEPLTQEEINYYLSRLSKDLSPNRVAVIETALRSIGKIPYYFGGKTHNFGYEKNAFGSKVPADYKGRCLKGLDCSGWVNWVYGTTFDKYIIKSEGTNKLAGEGTKIIRDELLPGDIIVRPGIDSHVMMFYEWAEDGRMTVIHENGGVNNVSIGTFDAYYPYYRRILSS